MQGDRVKKLMFSYSDNVDKELKYNQYISISSIDSHASHTKEECSSEKTGIQSLENLQWRYFGDNLDGAIAKCLLCKYNPTKGDGHKSSLFNKYSSSQVQPWSSMFAAKAPPQP